MINEKQINTRIQLKNDIEANWIKAINFSPLPGEVIIYGAETKGDNSQLPKDSNGEYLRDYWITYPRIKIGNVQRDNVNNLPFIDTALWDQIGSMNRMYATDDGDGNVALGASPLSRAEEERY